MKFVWFVFWFVTSSVSHCRFRVFSNCRLCLHLRNLKRLLMIPSSCQNITQYTLKSILVFWNSTLTRNRKQGFGSEMCIQEAPTIFHKSSHFEFIKSLIIHSSCWPCALRTLPAPPEKIALQNKNWSKYFCKQKIKTILAKVLTENNCHWPNIK